MYVERYRCRNRAFTLVELLIAMALMGLIATFAIPKVLNAQQGSSYKHKVREVAAMVSSAYQRYQIDTGASGSTGIASLTPYMSYLAIDTTSSLDDDQGETSLNCTSTLPCLKMPNGSYLEYEATATFGGMSATNAVWFHIDPDGKLTDSTTNSIGKSAPLFLYYQNGRITDEGQILTGTQDSGGTYNPDSSKVPPWFNWN